VSACWGQSEGTGPASCPAEPSFGSSSVGVSRSYTGLSLSWEAEHPAHVL
jgi:hypothetical protein